VAPPSLLAAWLFVCMLIGTECVKCSCTFWNASCVQAQTSKHQRSLGQIATAQFRVTCLKRCIRLWTAVHANCAPKRLQLQLKLIEHAHLSRARALRCTWGCWAERHQGWLVHKVLLGRAMVHYRMTLLVRVLWRWAAWAHSRRQEHEIVRAALTHWRTRVLRATLKSWKLWRLQKVQQRCAQQLTPFLLHQRDTCPVTSM
jgi:hypothetical protein